MVSMLHNWGVGEKLRIMNGMDPANAGVWVSERGDIYSPHFKQWHPITDQRIK